MSNIEYATIKTKDKRVREIIQHIVNEKVFLTEAKFFDDYIYIKGIDSLADSIMVEITKKIRDTKIEMSISFEPEKNAKQYKVTYINGLSTVQNIDLQYHFSFLQEHEKLLEETKKGLMNNIFMRTKNYYLGMDMYYKFNAETLQIYRNIDKSVRLNLIAEGLSTIVIKKSNHINIESVKPIRNNNEYKDIDYDVNEEYGVITYIINCDNRS